MITAKEAKNLTLKKQDLQKQKEEAKFKRSIPRLTKKVEKNIYKAIKERKTSIVIYPNDFYSNKYKLFDALQEYFKPLGYEVLTWYDKAWGPDYIEIKW